MKKIKKIFLSLVGIALNFFFVKETYAQSGQFLYGVDMPPVRTPGPTDIEWWSLERILGYIALPLVLIIILFVGILVFIKRRRK